MLRLKIRVSVQLFLKALPFALILCKSFSYKIFYKKHFNDNMALFDGITILSSIFALLKQPIHFWEF